MKLHFKTLLFALAIICSYFNMVAQSSIASWAYQGGGLGVGPNPAGLDTASLLVGTPSLDRLYSPVSGDLDGDGDMDFITGGRTGQLFYYENIGTPSSPGWVKTPHPNLDTLQVQPNGTINEIRPQLEDIDNDGDLDLFVGIRYNWAGGWGPSTGTSTQFRDIMYFENIGSASNSVFVRAYLPGIDGPTFADWQNTGTFTNLGFVDIDNDGDRDFFTIGSDSVSYFQNIGSPSNPSFQRYYRNDSANPLGALSSPNYTSMLISMPEFEDFDNDGDFDLYFVNEAGFLQFVENVGTASVPDFSPYTPIQGSPAISAGLEGDLGNFGCLIFDDLDGDGVKDAIYGNFNPGYFAWWKGIPNCSNDVGTLSTSVCGSYTVPSGDETYTSSGVYMDTIPTTLGCDSVLTITVTINNNSTATDVITACDSYVWRDGNTYTSSNNSATHTVVGAATNGCDSVYTLNLTINNSNTGIDTQVACDSYTWIDGITYASSNNTATHTLTNMSGCDSVVTLNLTINNSNTGMDTQIACDSYTWIDGNTYTSSNNTATHTLTNAAGCDSVVTLNLTINNSSTGVDTQVACNSYTWIDGVTYTSSNNTATHTLTNVVGCDSVVTLNLTINNSNTGVDTQIACNSYTWIDGVTYTSSNNTATHTLTNVAGCDSVVTLNLTINSVINVTDVQAGCDSYTWIDGNTYTSSNNTATHTLQSVQGCDSIITLNLTINNSTTGTDTQVACDSYTWIDGVTYTSSNNTATHTLTNAVGCDSVVTLDLTINNSTTGIDTQVACNSYTWIDGVTYTSSNSTATHTLTNAVGCDSVVTLDLTINTSNTGVDTQVACLSYTWIDGQTYTSSNNTATHTLTNIAGCDSVVTLNLTINTSVSSSIDTTICYGSVYSIGNSSYTMGGTYVDTLLSMGGCDSIVTSTVTVENQIDTYVERLNDVYTVNQLGAQYQWVDCNDNYAFITNATNRVYTATEAGDYAVIVSMGTCQDTSICQELPYIVGIDNVNNEDVLINVYPNPINEGNLTIDLDSSIEKVELTLRDHLGKAVYYNILTGVNNISLPMEYYNNGIYVLELRSNKFSKVIKVIKQ